MTQARTASIDLMLARLQQITTLLLLLAAATWAAYFFTRGQWGWAVLGAAAILCAHSVVLAAEFMTLALTSTDTSVPRPTPGQLVTSWWGEVITVPQVFYWRQPFRSRSEPDFLPDGLRIRGVVLLHGFACNRGLWNPWLNRLRKKHFPFIAVNLEPLFGSIDHYTGVIEAAIERIEAATGNRPVIVAHSMGGLAVRAWLAQGNNASRIHHVITIGTPHQGTWLARFGHSTNARQMRLHSPWLQELAMREPARRYEQFTCIYSHCDNIVFPTDTARLPGARNLHVPATAHVRLAFQGQAFEELVRCLQLLPTQQVEGSPSPTVVPSDAPRPSEVKAEP